MDHYCILFVVDHITRFQESFLANTLEKIDNQLKKWCETIHFPSRSISRKKQVYFSIISTAKCNSHWEIFTTNLKETFFLVDWKNLDNKAERNDLTTVTNHLHILADQLPSPGSHLLDILWLCTADCQFNISKNIQLFGSLKRLVDWHCGHVTLISQEKIESNWTSWIDQLKCSHSFNCLKSSIILDSVVWRGAVHIKDSKTGYTLNLPGFALLQINEATKILTSNPEHFDFQLKSPKKKVQFVISNQLEVINFLHPRSIPSYLFSTVVFKFCLESSSSASQRSNYFASLLTPQNCCIVKLQFIEEQILNPETNSFSFENWMMTICEEGNPGVSSVISKKFQGHVEERHFLITKDEKYEYVAIMLHSAEELDGSVAHFLTSVNPKIINNANVSDITQILNILPRVGNFEAFLKLLDLQSAVLEEILVKKKPDDTICLGGLTSLLQLVKEEIYSKLNNICPKTEIAGSVYKEPAIQSEFQLDSQLWLEKYVLQVREITRQKLKRFHSSDTLKGIMAIPSQGLSLDVKEFLKHFDTSGQSNDSKTTVISVRDGGSTMKPRSSLHEVLTAVWPDTEQILFHDIYYNKHRKSVSGEERCLKIKERYLKNETASTVELGPSSSIMPMCLNIKRLAEDEKTVTEIKENQIKKQKLNSHNSKRKLAPTDCSKSSNPKQEIVRESRSQRHARKLKQVVDLTLAENGISSGHPCFNNCSKRLFSLCKSFLKDLPTSRHLSIEMRKTASNNVKQVIDFEMQRASCKSSLSSSISINHDTTCSSQSTFM